MDTKDRVVGALARLPNDELVRIEVVYPDGEARVRRIECEREGTLAICAIDKLLPAALPNLSTQRFPSPYDVIQITPVDSSVAPNYCAAAHRHGQVLRFLPNEFK